MSDAPKLQHRVRVADLTARKPYRFDLRPSPDQLRDVADALELVELRKLNLKGTLTAKGRKAWILEASLGATAVQACVVTLAPVVTRIDVPVRRVFTEDYDESVSGDDIEMPEDDTIEPLSAEMDLLNVAAESLGLALPDYPRADDAALNISTFAAPGVDPMTEEDVKPFAGLADLKAKLESPDKE